MTAIPKLPQFVADPRTGRAYSATRWITRRRIDVAATYAQRIKNKAGTTRKSSPRAAPRADQEAGRAATAPAASAELQQLKDELRRINQEISKLARVTRPGPDAARRSQLPEKQELLGQKIDLERKIRAASKP